MSGTRIKRVTIPSLRRGSKAVTSSQVRSMMRQHDMQTREIKKYAAHSSGTTSSSGVVIPITVNIPQGDNISGRSGDQIRVCKFEGKVLVAMNAIAISERYRVIYFIDHYNLGSTPAVLDVLDTAFVGSFMNYTSDQAHRFHILYDKLHTLNAGGGSGITLGDSFTLRFRKSKLVNFLGTSSVQGAGHFYVLILSDLGSNNGQYDLGWNVRYQDA